MSVAIRASGISKRYRLGRRERYGSLRESLTRLLSNPFAPLESLPGVRRSGHSRTSAFEIAERQAVGLIGRNGAGKSTLLKILSRITEPTAGEVVIHGRVGSLLEVGTGFHPELTGRENIFLNGAILGMSGRRFGGSSTRSSRSPRSRSSSTRR